MNNVLRNFSFFVGLLGSLVFGCHSVKATTQSGLHQSLDSLTIDVGNMSVKNFFRTLQSISGVAINYADGKIPVSKSIWARYRYASFEKLMDDAVLLLNAKWKFSNTRRTSVVVFPSYQNEIYIEENIRALNDTTIDVSGSVNADVGVLEGASVYVKGGKSTQTDVSGRFLLSDIAKGSVVVIRFLGYNSEEVLVDRSQRLVVMLKRSADFLEESVVIGYGTVRRKDNTGSVVKIKGVDIERQPLANPILALQGRVAGLIVSQSSGVPGAEVKVNLRGQYSILNGSALPPLYIIDGVPFEGTSLTNAAIGGGAASLSPFNTIPASSIESIEVLKDADATAIYGSRGANGVILITTKKGRIGKTKLDLDLMSGVGNISSRMDLLNRSQYLEMRREAFKNDGVTTLPLNAYDLNGTWDTLRQTDWQGVFLGGEAHFLNFQAAISAGSEKTQFVLRSGYTRETSVFPKPFPNQKMNFGLTLSHRSNDNRFSATASVSRVNEDSDLPIVDPTKYFTLAPNAPAIFDSLGNLNWQNNTWINPFGDLLKKANADTYNLIGNTSMSYRVLPGLHLKLNAGFNELNMNQSITVPLTAFSPISAGVTSLRSNTFAATEVRNWIIEPQVQYDGEWRGFKYSVMFGGTFQDNFRHTVAQKASNFVSDEMILNIAAATTVSVLDNRRVQYRYASAFSRVNLGFRSRYLVTLTARRDGSTRFGPDRRFGNFGSVAGAWIFSEESFLKNKVKFLSLGKIRTSYGVTGSDQLGDYQYLSTYSSFSFAYLGRNGLYPTRIANPSFGWEEVKKYEAALELGFLNNRLMLQSIYYRNRTGNQLVGYSLPLLAGFASVQANLPAKIQNSGFEFELNTTNLQGKKWNWSTSLNLSVPQTKLVSYPDFEKSSLTNRYVIGKPLTIRRLYKYLGVDPQTGVYKLEDVNKDGVISQPIDYAVEKNVAARFFGGMQNTISFKRVALSVFLQYVAQTGLINSVGLGIPGSYNVNQPSFVMRRWQSPGDDATIQKFSQSSTLAVQSYQNAATRGENIVGDASFARLKNLYLSYDLEEWLLKKGHIRSFRLYVSMQNLLTITNFVGVDPETQSSTLLPPVRMISGGIQIGF